MNMRSQLGHVGRYTCNNATWRADTCSDLDNSDRSDEWVDIDTGQLDFQCNNTYIQAYFTCTG